MDVLISFCFVMTTPYFKNSITNDYDYKFYLACFFVWLYGTIVASSIFVSNAQKMIPKVFRTRFVDFWFSRSPISIHLICAN